MKTPVSRQTNKQVAASKNPAANPKVRQTPKSGGWRPTTRKAKGAPRGW